ncbi:MAG: hypothetical protein IIW77_00970 [Bacteroidaceae bacterium]|nr:hypothetical protein [Bacteroidaceae bacterium]
MIDKELSELIDALTRESGEPMLPCQELALLGYDLFTNSFSTATQSSYLDEEYDFDESDEEFRLLSLVLRLNNSRKKYFA